MQPVVRAYVDPAFAALADGEAGTWAAGSIFARSGKVKGDEAFATIAEAVDAAGAGAELWLSPGDHDCPALALGCELIGCGPNVTTIGFADEAAGLYLNGPSAATYWRLRRLAVAGVVLNPGEPLGGSVVALNVGRLAAVDVAFCRREAPGGPNLPEPAVPSVYATGSDSAVVCVGCAGAAPKADPAGFAGSFRPPLAQAGGPASLTAAAYRHAATLEAPATGRYGAGDRRRVWVKVAEFRCEQEPVRGGELTAGRVHMVNSAYQLRCRGGLPASADMRVRFNGQVWEINDVKQWAGQQNDTYLGCIDARPEAEPRA